MADAKLTIKVGANVKDAARQLQALGYNIEDVKKSTDKANDSASIWQKTLKKGSEDNINKLVELGAKYLTLTTVISGCVKGVKSLVTEGLKINENASKQIESINTAWSDIKANLGSAILDTVSPALDTLLDKLEQIKEWSKTISGNADITATFDKVQQGLSDWSSISTETLKKASDDLEKHIDELGISSHKKYQDMLDAIDDEIKRRESLETAGENLETATKNATTALSSLVSRFSYTSDDKLQNAWNFLSQNSNYSTAFSEYTSKNELENKKGYAKSLLKQLDSAESDMNDDDMSSPFSNTGLDNSNAIDLMRESLNEMIEALDEAIQALKGDMPEAAEEAKNALEDVGNAGQNAGEDIEEVVISARDAFNALCDSATSTISTFWDLMDSTYEKEIQAVEDSEASEEEKNAKINELKRKQFEAEKANAITQASISVVTGLVDILSKYSTVPWLAGTLTALLLAQTGMQIATIKNQNYTGFADGGIVQSPTHALIGEGAEKEAVLPLSKLEDFVNRDSSSGGTIVINVSVDGSGNNTAEDVYYAIERAQRTGLLPRWRYA